MKYTQLFNIIILTSIMSGCSTLNNVSSKKEITKDTPNVVESAPQSQTVKQKKSSSVAAKKNKTTEKQSINTAKLKKSAIPSDSQKEIELDTKKPGSTANNQIPLEKSYPFQTEKPRFTLPENVGSASEKNKEKETEYAFLFDRIIAGYKIDVIENAKVKKYRKFYLDNTDYVELILERSRPYLFFIVEEIEKRGLPMELALLPAIERAYLTNETSSSNAAGLWQFIPTTGRYFGLKQNWWSDQRRDVILSTQSALDYLKELNFEFEGDWHLSIAAYNGGRGNIANAIKHNKKKGLQSDYFSLKLSKETSNYVPKFLALVDVIKNAHLYNINIPEIPNFPYFTLIKTPGQIDMTQLVNNTAVNKDIFYQLNAGFKRSESSPEGPHRLIIPVNSSKKVQAYLASQPKKPRIQWRNHKLKKGDTLYGLAREYKVSIRAIKTINNMKSSLLRAGRTILIPLRSV